MRLKVALCPVGFMVRSPGSWLEGSWVSGLLSVGCFCTFIAILPWCLVVDFCFVQDPIQFLNSLAHKLPCLLRARPSRGGCCCCCCFCLFCVFFVVVFVWFGCFLGWSVSLVDTAIWTCWTAYWSMLSFDSPMREHTGHCTIRSMAQTLCYDLARAKKAKDGKKVVIHVFPHWVNREMRADKRFAARPHACLPTVSQQWAWLVRLTTSMRLNANSLHCSRQPLNALWYLASICSRTSHDHCCNSASTLGKLSFSIAMTAQLLRLFQQWASTAPEVWLTSALTSMHLWCVLARWACQWVDHSLSHT